jgi:hypothetical protein
MTCGRYTFSTAGKKKVTALLDLLAAEDKRGNT